MDHNLKNKIAQQSARLFVQQMIMAGVPPDLQLEAIAMAAKATFTSSVAEPKRLELLDKWLKNIRDGVRAGMKKERTNARKPNHR